MGELTGIDGDSCVCLEEVGGVMESRPTSAFEVIDLSRDECSFCLHLLGRSRGGGLKNHHLLSSIFFLSSLALCPRGFQLVTKNAPLGILGYIQSWALLDDPLQVLTPSCSNSHFIQVKTGKV